MGGELTDLKAVENSVLPIYSRKLLEVAQPLMHFWNLCVLDKDLRIEAQPGQQVRFNIDQDLTGDAEITDEDTPIGIEKSSFGKNDIFMKEFGRGQQFSRVATVSSLINLLERAKVRLGKHYALTMDRYLSKIFFTTANKYYALATGASGAAYSDVNNIFDVKTLDSVKEKAQDLNFPYYQDGVRGNYWVFVGTGRQIRQINRDKLLVYKKNYAEPKDWMTGEIGMFDGVVFLSSTEMNRYILPGASANTKDVHRGLLIAPGAVGIIRSIAMRLSLLPWDEIKRTQYAIWYALLGAGILQDYIYEVATEDGLPSYT